MAHPAPQPGHAHDDGAVHAHVSSAFFYMAVFAALIVLTVSTVAQSYVDLGSLNIVLVIVIASMKASLVVAFFMHLRWDNKFNALIFISCLLFIGVFFAYTMNDTEHRGEMDAEQNVKVLPTNGQEAPGGFVPRQHAGDGAEHGGGEHGTKAPPAGAPAHPEH